LIISKAYLSNMRVTNISKSFTHKMAAETRISSGPNAR